MEAEGAAFIVHYLSTLNIDFAYFAGISQSKDCFKSISALSYLLGALVWSRHTFRSPPYNLAAAAGKGPHAIKNKYLGFL